MRIFFSRLLNITIAFAEGEGLGFTASWSAGSLSISVALGDLSHFARRMKEREDEVGLR